MSADGAAAGAPVADPAAALLDRYDVAGGFLFTRDGGGLVAGGGRQSMVDPGPDHVGRAAVVADRLLEAAADGGADVVVGALPFDGSVRAVLTRPAWVRWSPPPRHSMTGTATTAAVAAALERHREEPGGPAYAAAVADATRRIEAGELRKVVLARSRVVATPGPAELREILRRLQARDPHAYVFAAAIPDAAGGDGSVVAGASPELLVRRRGEEIVSMPLAGTAPRHADATADRDSADRLSRSAKDSAEHRFVVEAVADTLAPFCTDLSVDPGPSLEPTAAVWHLATTIRGRLRSPAPSALALAAALHPTPAVGGVPREAALRVIAELEPVPRGFYAGCTGWVDKAGDGEWVVNLRCLEVQAGGTRLFAGAGIVAGSDPQAELAETGVKFGTLLQALATG